MQIDDDEAKGVVTVADDARRDGLCNTMREKNTYIRFIEHDNTQHNYVDDTYQ